MKISEIFTKEAVRPKHVHALIHDDPLPIQDKVKYFAGQIEKELDSCLHQLKKPTADMNVVYSRGQIHVVIRLAWIRVNGPKKVPYYSLRIGLGDTISYFPINFKDAIKKEIIHRYSEVGWHVQLKDDKANFYHPIDSKIN